MFNFARDRRFPTLLLIDDDTVSREVTATVLTMSGYAVHTAESGNASVELLGSGRCSPDAILMDARMPGLSGVRLIEALRAHSRARVYAISASSVSEDVMAASDGFLLKPFDAGELTRLLEKSAPQPPTAVEEIDHAQPPGVRPAERSVGQVVSPTTLAQLRDIMSDAAVREIYEALVADMSRRLALLQAAIESGNREEVCRIGHAIKGGCAVAGALQLARLGAQLEAGNAAQASYDLKCNRALFGDLEAAARNLERMLEAEFPA